ncbi:hypothetical protein L2E82_36027 [Cichorium intybus]|uniref:Uncharacterized protein n=1 Tax=Cichorium intybus TaxID=13427 RepID=A0ACB9BQF8_CICIN|nr:hypothetical protein L2E82_36027 [Cichorium intybus]
MILRYVSQFHNLEESTSLAGFASLLLNCSAVDAIDNGINQYETDQPPRYLNNTTLSSRISRLNMNWYDVDQSPQKEDKAFQQAMNLVGSEFMDCIYFHAKSWLPTRSVVMECLATRKNIDSSGEMMLLTSSCPVSCFWEALPSQWRGLTDDHLFEVAGISGCVFVHSSGFIGGNKSYEVMSSTVAKKKDSLRTQGSISTILSSEMNTMQTWRKAYEILAYTSVVPPRADVQYCLHAVARRLAKTRNWTVAIKTLIVIHRTLREGDPTFREELVNFRQRGCVLQLGWDCSAWVRTYGLLLDERLECFRVLKYDIEAKKYQYLFKVKIIRHFHLALLK